MRCDKYIGDNDGTCPQLTCIRAPSHPGHCDNLRGDYQVWGYMAPEQEGTPISYAYPTLELAEVVLERAMSQLSGFWLLTIQSSENAQEIDATTFLDESQALALFERLHW